MKIEARFEVGLKRPPPSKALTPARYLSKLSDINLKLIILKLKNEDSYILSTVPHNPNNKILLTLFCLQIWPA